ncbi:MAG: hypothetical protein H7836_08500 [Magnetococcus sp. YQC-3]
MSEAKQDTPFSPADASNALLLQGVDADGSGMGLAEDASPVSLTSLAELPATEWAEAPAEEAEVQHLESVEEVVSPPKATAARSVTVHIEPLGAGIANLLTDAVEQVVKVAKKGAGRVGAPVAATSSASGLREGVRAVVADVGELVQTGANVVTGLVDCLQQSMRCMGRVIMNPRKPCRKSPSRNETARTASTAA